MADYLYNKVFSNIGSQGVIQVGDLEQTFISGQNPNNYVWYSGKLWRVISIDTADNSVKMMTEEPISAVSYNPNSSTSFKGSQMEQWLNDTSTDGFLGNLKEPSRYLKLNSKWNATVATTDAKPAKTTMIEDAVGLITMYESAFIRDFLLSFHTWMLTPYDSNRVWMINYSGSRQAQNPDVPYAVQPVINIKSNIIAVAGNGTHDNPYRLEGDSISPSTGTLLSTRYSGEYIRFGSGENNLYRIVSKENNGIKIVSATSLKKNNVVFTKMYGKANEQITYSPGSTNYEVAYWLNNDYLNPSNGYITASYLSMIQNNTWYLGKITNGMHYRLAKYTTATGTTLVGSKVSSRVGLLRMGEQLAAQTDKGSAFWLITPNNGTVRVVAASGYSASEYATSSFSVRPALVLKPTIKITGGDGTRQNPFVLSE